MHSFESKNRSTILKERVIKIALILASTISILTTFGILFSILFEAISFFQLRSFWYFLTGTTWSPGVIGSQFGAVPIFAGTLMITFIAMAVALPVGLGSAIYMSEYATGRTRDYLKPVLEILAGIPTVVYGFFAAITVAPFVVKAADFFGLEATFNSALASGIVMGIMIIPVISSLSDDVIRAVPDSQRKASLGLGMTQGETIKNIVLPSALPGIISATLLGFSKAIGETMIVVMAAGLRPNLSFNPLEDMTTVTVRIVDALVGDQAFNSPETLSAFALGLALFVVTLFLNIISLMMIRKFKEKYKVNTL
ncbi:phosphate ABC transporter permease subunit PstC [Halarcobacter ebronensis]|uniref:Phosphate transport system permease protein n=1 Tax=Halarcobacter ebronensis TaxID=1462615 RepID=A0A4Q1ARX6_9BACT|nr:phosphate ABC transporter, permease protein [Halarcobacter ebronensis]RXJ67981.1 phosphate ABC transporter permease subunit PstC [Halarcobacter ebronensis]RXK08597.1 phosphate ABC transporter permease subunit PstC [Halarcobacter ebronensis]